MVHLIVKDPFDQAYELTDRANAPRSSSAKRYRSDAYSTFRFVARLPLAPQQWMQILRSSHHRVSELHSHHPGAVYQAVAESLMRGDLALYQLPAINSFNALRGKNGVGLTIIKGPNPHGATNLTPEPITNQDAAKRLLHEVGISEAALIAHLINENLYSDEQRRLPVGRVLILLATGELLAYKIPLPTSAPPPKPVEYLPNTAADRTVPLAPENNSKPVAKKPSMLEARKSVSPSSMKDAENRLASMKQEIADNGHQPKYTDEQLLQQAQQGEVANERYHVRFMEVSHQWDRNDTTRDTRNLTGKLGREFSGETGTGPRYWSTTFDQIEDADSDAKLICLKLGIDYDLEKEYVMAIIDTEKAKPLTGCECVAATFNNISEFSNRELPAEFPKEFTDQVMNAQYQEQYKACYQEARDNKFLKSDWSTNTDDFSAYLSTTNLTEQQKELMIHRMKMHAKIGNNQHYLGNGVTENKIVGSHNKFGAVETHNFERTPTDLQKLKTEGAIKLIYL